MNPNEGKGGGDSFSGQREEAIALREGTLLTPRREVEAGG